MSQENVLVIDDEEVMRDVLQSLLQEAGYRVTLAHDGIEGLALAKKQSYEAATPSKIPLLHLDCVFGSSGV